MKRSGKPSTTGGGSANSSHKEPAQLRYSLGRRLIDDVMARRHTPAGDIGGVLTPDRERVVVLTAEALRTPQHQRRTCDLALAVGFVVHEVDSGAGAIILAIG